MLLEKYQSSPHWEDFQKWWTAPAKEGLPSPEEIAKHKLGLLQLDAIPEGILSAFFVVWVASWHQCLNHCTEEIKKGLQIAKETKGD